MQERLSLPAFAAAVADVLRCCADALPTLKGITRQEASLSICGCIHYSLALAILLLTSLAAATLLLSPPWKRCIFWEWSIFCWRLDQAFSVLTRSIASGGGEAGSGWRAAELRGALLHTHRPTRGCLRRRRRPGGAFKKANLPFLAVLPGLFSPRLPA